MKEKCLCRCHYDNMSPCWPRGQISIISAEAPIMMRTQNYSFSFRSHSVAFTLPHLTLHSHSQLLLLLLLSFFTPFLHWIFFFIYLHIYFFIKNIEWLCVCAMVNSFKSFRPPARSWWHVFTIKQCKVAWKYVHIIKIKRSIILNAKLFQLRLINSMRIEW